MTCKGVLIIEREIKKGNSLRYPLGGLEDLVEVTIKILQNDFAIFNSRVHTLPDYVKIIWGCISSRL